jgi:pre-mRNA-splicing factor ATP-dependent RNA helicase DHX15/PRP43
MSSKANPALKEPLYGFLPRRVVGKQVRQALVGLCKSLPCLIISKFFPKEHELNPFTKELHTAQYRKLLDSRKKLPVFAQMDEFYKMVCSMAPATLGERCEFCFL